MQESRIEELRETHRLESESSSSLVGNLRDQLAKAETTLSTQATQLLQLATTQAELQTAQARVREEEEKRGKAVALLKTVRGKLVKLEREREQVDKRQEEEHAERQRLVGEVERLKAERETVKVMQEKEVAAIKERYEKEMLAKRREWELEMITTKVRVCPYPGAMIWSHPLRLRSAGNTRKRHGGQIETRQFPGGKHARIEQCQAPTV